VAGKAVKAGFKAVRASKGGRKLAAFSKNLSKTPQVKRARKAVKAVLDLSRWARVSVTGKIDDFLRVSGIPSGAIAKGEKVAVSKAEMNFYKKLKLESTMINGRPALKRVIDPMLKTTDEMGRTMTNLERMQKGLSPYVINAAGKAEKVTLHHVRQQVDGVLAEVLKTEEKSVYNILHDALEQGQKSQIDRKVFGKEQKKYWMERAKEYM